MGRWIRRLFTVTLLVALLLVAALWWYARQASPQIEGSLNLPGAKAALRIERDVNGIPTIRADSVRDAMFGLGVAHAQDRLWQMETHRRIGAGRLAEAFGEGAVDTDKFLRTLGVRRAAARQWAQASPRSREVLQAYTDGVNAVIGQLKARPPEFILLGVTPEPWEPVDSLAWAIMMAWDLGSNWQTELTRLRLSAVLSKEHIDQLLPPYPGDPVPASQDYTQLYRSLKLNTAGAAGEARLARLMDAAPESEVLGVGSNNWVLAGSRSTTGKPLLASDPHLKLSSPALWYFARLEAPGLKMAGATLPGLPGVVMGQNEHVAWGFTNTNPDVQDTYLERLKPGDATQVQTPDGWAPLVARQEVIKVRGGAPVTITVRESRHGPVISDTPAAAFRDNELGGKDAYVIALRWTGLDADNDMMSATLGMNAAASVDDFVRASAGWVAPQQNMAVADDAGHIALVTPARVPLRRADNDLHGLAPAPGWDARYDWAGYVPVEALPQQRDPDRGYIATANHKITPPGYPYFIGSAWAAPYRYDRIVQMIEAQPQHSLADLQRMQADVKSLAAARVLPHLLKATSTHPLAAAAQQALAGFDGTMAADKAAPLIYWAWRRQLGQLVLADKLGPTLFARISPHEALAGILERNDAWWCDDKSTPAVETCADQVNKAFTAALVELQSAYGADVSAWQWGRAHQARSEHRPFSRVKPLARWFEQRQSVGGDTFTVNVSAVSLKPDATTGELYLDEHGPSLRGVYDLADRYQSRVMHSTGQSGLPWSPLFRSFGKPWQQVQGVPLWAAPDAPLQTLVILPSK
jgi:penicillin amidase